MGATVRITLAGLLQAMNFLVCVLFSLQLMRLPMPECGRKGRDFGNPQHPGRDQ